FGRPIGTRAWATLTGTPRAAKTATNASTGAQEPKSIVVPAQSKTTRRISVAGLLKAGLQVGAKVFEVRRRQAGDLGGLVPAAQGEGGVGPRTAAELLLFGRRHRSALAGEAVPRRLGQPRSVARLGGDEVALGGDVEPDRLGVGGREEGQQPAGG